MYSGVCRHVALPLFSLAGLAGFGLLVGRRFSPSKTRSECCRLAKILQSKVFMLLNNHDVVDERDDIISQLPDDILISIISRLSPIDAVRTSILSSAWRNLYRFIHHVKFDYDIMLEFCYRKNPRTGVEAVETLLQHHSGSKLVSFQLALHFSYPYMSPFFKWIQYVSRLGVEQLDLLYCFEKGCTPSFFNWNLLSEASSLEKVSLYKFTLKSELINQFYPFKILKFHYVTFAPGAIECIMSSCPSLVSLTMTKCTFPSKISIHNPNLTSLRIELWIQSQVKEIELCAAKLNSFEYIDCERRRLTFTFVPSLERLSIKLFGNNIEPSIFGQFIKDLPRVKSLYYEYSGSNLQVYKIRELNNALLRNLREIILVKPECDLLKITTIFDACPLLRKFHLALQTRKSALYSGQKVVTSAGPHPQLEEVEISGFSGTGNEMSFAYYILKIAVSLERMRIIRCPKCYEGYGRWEWMENTESRFNEEKRKMIHELLRRKALSKSAQVIILG